MQALAKYLARLAKTNPQAAEAGNEAMAFLIRHKMKNGWGGAGRYPLGEVAWALNQTKIPLRQGARDRLEHRMAVRMGEVVDSGSLSRFGSPPPAVFESLRDKYKDLYRQLRGRVESLKDTHGYTPWARRENWPGLAYGGRSKIDKKIVELEKRQSSIGSYADNMSFMAGRRGHPEPPPDALEKFLRKYTRGDTSQPLDLIAEAKRKYGK